MATGSTFGTAPARLSGLFTNWFITIWLTLEWLLDFIQQLSLTFCTLKVSFLAWTPGEHCLIVLLSKVNTFSLSETRTDDFYSLDTPKVVVSSLTLASRSHYVSGRLEPFSTMLPLGSTDSVFFLQCASSVCVAIARWKHVDTFLQTALGLPIVPWLTHLYQLRTLLISWKSIQVHLPSLLKNDLLLPLSPYECSIVLLFWFCK